MCLKKKLSAFALLLLAVVLTITSFSPQSVAAEGNAYGKLKKQEMKFDLTKNEKQEFRYVDENGEEVIYGAEPVLFNEGEELTINSNLTRQNPISYGSSTWKIYVYSGSINMSYYINIYRTSYSTKITDAYDLWTAFIGYTENNVVFGHTSTKAEYTSSANLFNSWASIRIRLTATVSGGTLTTSATY
jgi:hypothetical protein